MGGATDGCNLADAETQSKRGPLPTVLCARAVHAVLFLQQAVTQWRAARGRGGGRVPRTDSLSRPPPVCPRQLSTRSA
jgi:hypothetical protein